MTIVRVLFTVQCMCLCIVSLLVYWYLCFSAAVFRFSATCSIAIFTCHVMLEHKGNLSATQTILKRNVVAAQFHFTK